MTAQLPSKERLEKIVSWRETYGAGHNVMLPAEEAEALARFALAAYEQEPMMTDQAETLQKICNIFRIGIQAQTQSTILANVENAVRFADQLHAIEREFFMVPGEPDEDYPDDEPADVCLVNCWGSTTEQYVEQFRAALKKIAPPAPVAVPECFQRLLKHSHGMSMGVDWNNGTSAGFHREKLLEAVKDCRAAMLNHSEQSLAMVNPPAIPAGWKLVPETATKEMVVSAMSDNLTGEVSELYDLMLAVAPQPPAAPEVPHFRENENSSTKCWCRTCRPITLTDMRFVVCPDCGNKRCPHANDHRNPCTGSNEPGQPGSAYPAAPNPEGK